MQFIDTLKLHAKGGRGGDGCLSFRREKYVEFGGPDGGAGGHGGSVWLVADSNLSTLLDLAAHPHRTAWDGTGGKGSDQTGACGEDLVVKVPVGTIVYRDAKLIGDLTETGQRLLIAKGGRGGRGNAAFKTHRDNAPRIREHGEPGEEAILDLELRLLADVGLLGFPNAGKSTLLAAVSNARPKIADYAFTTLAPNLGMVKHRGKSFVLADIPGLIEGAHEGKGLGIDFLRHLARTRVLIHLVDPFGFNGLDAATTIRTLEKELAAYSKEMKGKPRFLVVTKQDLTDADKVAAKLKKKYPARRVFMISSAAHKGISTLLDAVLKELEKAPPPPPAVDTSVEEHPGGKRPFTVEKEHDVFVVRGDEAVRMANMTDWNLVRGTSRLMNILKSMGIERQLVKLGVQPGDTVRIGTQEFFWMDPKDALPLRTPARRRKSYRTPLPSPE